jgi:hypothetical protein
VLRARHAGKWYGPHGRNGGRCQACIPGTRCCSGPLLMEALPGRDRRRLHTIPGGAASRRGRGRRNRKGCPGTRLGAGRSALGESLRFGYGHPPTRGPGGCQLAVMNQLSDPKGTVYANALPGEPLDRYRVQCATRPCCGPGMVSFRCQPRLRRAVSIRFTTDPPGSSSEKPTVTRSWLQPWWDAGSLVQAPTHTSHGIEIVKTWPAWPFDSVSNCVRHSDGLSHPPGGREQCDARIVSRHPPTTLGL